MDATELRRLIVMSEMAEHVEALTEHARPLARIVRTEREILPGQSRLNNAPDLPPDFPWPQHERGPYRFLAQFNLAELPAGLPAMPGDGLLSIFFQYDKEGECFWQDPGFVMARYFPATQKLVTTRQPESVNIGEPITVQFEASLDLPRPIWCPVEKVRITNWPFGKEFKAKYEDLRDKLPVNEDYLFGYPTNYTLGYDPTPGVGWQSLLTLCTDEDLEWYWHDGDRLVAFIETTKLAAGDFSEIRSDAG